MLEAFRDYYGCWKLLGWRGPATAFRLYRTIRVMRGLNDGKEYSARVTACQYFTRGVRHACYLKWTHQGFTDLATWESTGGYPGG